MNVVRLISPSAIDRAWDDYVILASAMQRDPKLKTDRRHVEATLRAHRLFTELFNASEVGV